MMIDVSIILIGYNDSARLPAALASLQGQSLRNIEIICIDDNSTDNSMNILQTAALNDPRIRVEQLPKNSGGCSAPRNRGLALAQGEYVMFCDSDDTYDRHACRNLILAAREMQADLVVGAAERFISDTGQRKIWWPELHDHAAVHQSLGACPELLYDTISVNKIFRRELLVSHHIDFPEGLLFEDQLFTLKAYLAAQRIGVIAEVVYHWNVVRETEVVSITQSRKELRNINDRITINKLMDAELANKSELLLAKQVKFLRHEASLYLATIFESEPELGGQLSSILAEYCRTIPGEAYSEIRPGLRIAMYYLLMGDYQKLIKALWWEKGGGVLAQRLPFTSAAGVCLGRESQWWLNDSELHIALIPFGRRRYLHTWIDDEHITTVDFLGDLADNCTGELVFVEKHKGALASIPMSLVRKDENLLTWELIHDSLAFIQDRGVNLDESGTLQVEIRSEGKVNRSLLVDPSYSHLGDEFDFTSEASAKCATSFTLVTHAHHTLGWEATGLARGLTANLTKVRRKLNAGFDQRRVTFDLPTDRPVFLYAPAPLPDFESRITRFDTDAWIAEFGTIAYLLVPQERFTPAPVRATYAYRTYPRSREAELVAVADYLITDIPELAERKGAIPFRLDLGAARYLLPALSIMPIDSNVGLHEVIRELT
jgi:glycosyltransferase involved in cell wall biosynthesis